MGKVLKTRIQLSCLLILAVLELVCVAGAGAQGQPDFKGTTLKIIVGTATGGGVDLWTRLIAQ